MREKEDEGRESVVEVGRGVKIRGYDTKMTAFWPPEPNDLL